MYYHTYGWIEMTKGRQLILCPHGILGKNKCKECRREYQRNQNKQWRKNNPEKYKAILRRYRKNNPEKIKELRRQYKESGKALEVYRKWKKNHPKYDMKYYRKNREKILKRRKELRNILRLKVLIHYGGNPPKCICCGENHIEFLTIDHIYGGGNKHRKEIGGGYLIHKWLIKNDFPEGFRVLCYNCNCSLGHHGYCPHSRN